MPSVRWLLFIVVLVFAIPSFAKQENSSPASVEITGTVQSFSGDILDVKPANAPAVWVTIPSDLRVDRTALKEGAKVEVKAYWADVCYVATQVTPQN